MTQKLGIGKVLAIPALSASYGKLPNALARARNEKVACSSQVTSSIKTPGFVKIPGVFITFWHSINPPRLAMATIWLPERDFLFSGVFYQHGFQCTHGLAVSLL